MERRWIILIVAGAAIMATLIIGLLIHESFHRDYCTEDVCQSPECVQAAAQILNYIDVEVNPCDNFYQFVCGNFLKTTEIPDDMNEISTISLMNDDLQKQLRSALEEPIELGELKSFQLLKTYYKACSNTEAVERRGLQILLDLLKDVGGWPVLEDHSWDSKNLDWYYYVYKFRNLGLATNQFLQIDVQHDFKNTTHHIIQIDQPSFSLPRDFLIDQIQNEYVEKYQRYMVNTAVLLGAHEFRAIIELRDALKFEMKLASISLSKEERTNISNFYNIMSIKELEDAYFTIPWLEYINNIITPHYEITTNERILVLVPDYIERLEELLQKTSKRDQINYLVWKAIASIMPYLTEHLKEMEFKFQSGTSGTVQRLPRWKECIQETHKSLPIAFSALYVRRFFDEDIRVGVEEIIRKIKMEYITALEKVAWMDKKTKESAIEKINEMGEVIGYPEELWIDERLEEIYSEVEIHSKEYLKSFLNISTMNQNLKFKQLRLLKRKTAWMEHSSVAEAHASYSFLTNAITIPAGILQASYFNKNHPRYLNYGAIGSVIGHEITHAFDDTGRLFNKNGNMEKWWEKKTEESYLDLAECITDQYDNYSVTQVNQTINGVITLDENIADNGGVKHAYAAYLKWIEENNDEKKLPGLDYTIHQLFWISFALNQCTKQRPEHLELFMATSVHSPSEFRVIGPLSNSRQFAYDFDCILDTPMYKEDICVIW